VRSPVERLAAALAALLAVALSAAPAAAQETCVACHATQPDPRLRDPVGRLGASAHARAVGCTGCHGGRGQEPTAQAHDAAAGFLARPDPAAVAERCGACHADARFVRRFRAEMSTDQLALFRADGHGRALARGDRAAPSCLDCHGSHDVRPVADPSSRVARRRQHVTCGGCHADAARMAGSRLPTRQAGQWAESVHGRAVLRGNPAAPSCAGCHGAHGEFREAGGPEGQCRRCHEDEAAAFDRSPHAAVYRRLGFSGCVACHGSHDVREAEGSLGAAGAMGVCRRCHAEGRGSFDLARSLAAEAEGARRELSLARGAARGLDDDGLRVPAVTGLLAQAGEADQRLRVALHALDATVARDAAAAVRAPARRARELARDARRRDAHGRRAWRVAIPLLALFAALALLKIRALDRAGR
jgi:hypothetical protein